MASHIGEYCKHCKGPHKLRHGRPKKRVSRSRSAASKKGWAHRRHISPAKEASRVRKKGARKGARKGRKRGARKGRARR